MSHEHEYEEEFGAALRAAVAGSPEPAVELLAAGAQRRGRRKKLRRNLVAGTAAAAVVAGAGLATAQLQGGAHGTAQADKHATAVVSTPGSAASASASAGASAGPAPAPVTGEQMLALLKQRVPAGFQPGTSIVQGAVNNPNVKADGPFALLNVTDGQGQGAVSINVRVFPNPLDLSLSGLTCSTTPDPNTACTRVQLADNSYLRTIKRTNVFAGDTMLNWSADLERPDGLVVTAASSNETPNGAKAGRPTPPLSTDQLAALAQDQVWQSVTTGVKSGLSDIDPTAGSSRPVPLQQILGTAAALLPNGLTELTPGGEDSFASFQVNDGHGKSLVRVTVEDWSSFQPGRFSGGDITTEFTGATTEPDGTKVLTSHDDPFANYRGVVRNEARILTPNKLLIGIESFNSTDFKGGVTRPQPPLTVDQLTAMALSPSWRTPAG
ncbi:hypothetical protein [Kitasatospora viridis]|uniref:Uncharacterized protein n=1 Tax=Kitasatospora viridis TaxID=281105 RepID=A0A561UMY0_9ACTN|nr:hypothetical protein [Kitasatospora viridis]TWG00684.1 hypothetical protein FHX73_114564 [Kitasatospora viridis]